MAVTAARTHKTAKKQTKYKIKVHEIILEMGLWIGLVGFLRE
jgi:hypothetical protein